MGDRFKFMFKFHLYTRIKIYKYHETNLNKLIWNTTWNCIVRDLIKCTAKLSHSVPSGTLRSFNSACNVDRKQKHCYLKATVLLRMAVTVYHLPIIYEIPIAHLKWKLWSVLHTCLFLSRPSNVNILYFSS